MFRSQHAKFCITIVRTHLYPRSVTSSISSNSGWSGTNRRPSSFRLSHSQRQHNSTKKSSKYGKILMLWWSKPI